MMKLFHTIIYMVMSLSYLVPILGLDRKAGYYALCLAYLLLSLSSVLTIQHFKTWKRDKK